MGQVSRFLRRGDYGPGGVAWYFWCPGCEETHMFITQRGSYRPQGPVWSFDGDVERPTFSPSLIMWTGHYAPGHEPGSSCWCTYNERQVAEGKEPAPYKCGICHLHLHGGMLQYLPDSTHDLAGVTIPLPELPREHQDAVEEG